MKLKSMNIHPLELLSESLTEALWKEIKKPTCNFLSSPQGSPESELFFKRLYDQVSVLSKKTPGFSWIEFLSLTYALQNYIQKESTEEALPLMVRYRHKVYIVTSEEQAFYVSEKRFLDEKEYKALTRTKRLSPESLEDFIKSFYQTASEYYIKQKDLVALKKVQSFAIRFDPRNLEWLARRGLTNIDLLCYYEAVQDLKKYIFLTDGKNCPKAISNALIALQGLKTSDTLNLKAFSH